MAGWDLKAGVTAQVDAGVGGAVLEEERETRGFGSVVHALRIAGQAAGGKGGRIQVLVGQATGAQGGTEGGKGGPG